MENLSLEHKYVSFQSM